MKKNSVLIISHSFYPDIGGLEKYNDILLKKIFNKYNIDIFLTSNTDKLDNIKNYYKSCSFINDKLIKKQKSIFLMFLKIFKRFKFFKEIYNVFLNRKMFSKYWKDNKEKYDYIVDETFINFKELRSLNNCIYVPHSNAISIYKNVLLYKKTLKNKFKSVVINTINLLTKYHLSFKYYKNIVVFSENDKLTYLKRLKKKNKKNFYIIPNPCFSNFQKKLFNYNSKKIISTCRFEDLSKNLKLLNMISKNLKNKICVYGDGPDKKLLNNCIVMPKYNDNEIINAYDKSTLYLMTSNFEGQPLSLCESIYFGIPIVVMNTFASAEWLVDNGNNGLLISRDESIDNIVKKINNLLNDKEKMNKMSFNCFKFGKTYLTIDSFVDNWKKILLSINN